MSNVDFKNNDDLVEAFSERFEQLDNDIYDAEHEYDFYDKDEEQVEEKENEIR